MPIFNVRCVKCSYEGQITKKILEDNPPCEGCGETLETIIKSAPNVVFKGSGWAYKDIKEDRDMDKALR